MAKERVGNYARLLHGVVSPIRGYTIGRNCKKCGADRWRRANLKNGNPAWRCADCILRHVKNRKARHIDKTRDYSWKDRGIACTVAQYNEMFAAQGGKCALCDRAKTYRLRVDHCHETGKVRGLLCAGCNVLAQDVEKLRAVLSYVEAGGVWHESREDAA